MTSNVTKCSFCFKISENQCLRYAAPKLALVQQAVSTSMLIIIISMSVLSFVRIERGLDGGP